MTIFGQQEDFTIMFAKCKNNITSKINEISKEQYVEEFSFEMQKN